MTAYDTNHRAWSPPESRRRLSARDALTAEANLPTLVAGDVRSTARPASKTLASVHPSEECRGSKPILVGYDPATADRAPVNFGVAAARFTGAPLIVASAAAAVSDRPGAGQQDEDLVLDVSHALDEARRELEPRGSRSNAAR